MSTAPAFFHQKLPGFDYRLTPEERWWQYSLEDLRHPQDPLTTGPLGERASPPPWARSSRHRSPRQQSEFSEACDTILAEIDRVREMVLAYEAAQPRSTA